MPSINAVHSYLIKPITIPRYLTTVYCLRGAAPIGMYAKKTYFVLCPKIVDIKFFVTRAQKLQQGGRVIDMLIYYQCPNNWPLNSSKLP